MHTDYAFAPQRGNKPFELRKVLIKKFMISMINWVAGKFTIFTAIFL